MLCMCLCYMFVCAVFAYTISYLERKQMTWFWLATSMQNQNRLEKVKRWKKNDIVIIIVDKANSIKDVTIRNKFNIKGYNIMVPWNRGKFSFKTDRGKIVRKKTCPNKIKESISKNRNGNQEQIKNWEKQNCQKKKKKI